jgi:hypothetical protein
LGDRVLWTTRTILEGSHENCIIREHRESGSAGVFIRSDGGRRRRPSTSTRRAPRILSGKAGVSGVFTLLFSIVQLSDSKRAGTRKEAKPGGAIPNQILRPAVLSFRLLAECKSGPRNTVHNLVGSAFEFESNRMSIRENMNNREDPLMTLYSDVIASLGNLS